MTASRADLATRRCWHGIPLAEVGLVLCSRSGHLLMTASRADLASLLQCLQIEAMPVRNALDGGSGLWGSP